MAISDFVKKGSVVSADGTPLYVERYGNSDGPAILFLNNYFSVASQWRRFTRSLSLGYQIVAYDLVNQGLSGTRSGECGFDQHLVDLRTVFEHFALERPYLVATSDSTVLAREFALCNPDSVSGLVLIGPLFSGIGTRSRHRLVRSWMTVLAVGGLRALFDVLYPLFYSHRTIESGGVPAYLALRERFLATQSASGLLANMRTSLAVNDSPEDLRRIRCPVLVAAGDSDFHTSVEGLEHMAALISSADAAVIRNSAHLPYFEATGVFERLIADFIAGTSTQKEQPHVPTR